MRSFRDIINSWPSPGAFGDDLGITDTHARTMRRRNSIPFPYWDAVIAGAKARKIPGVTELVLKEIAKQSSPQRMPRRSVANKAKRAATIPANPPQGKAISA